MNNIYNGLGFIIGYLIIMLAFLTIFGEKATEAFLVLTLISMILFNSNKFISLLNSLKE